MSDVNGVLRARKSYARIPEVLPLPNLVSVQLDSFKWFREEGLRELLDEISPISSFNRTLEMSFLDYRFGEPQYTEDECREQGVTYAAPLWVKVRLVNNATGEVKEQEVSFGDFPLMTDRGTFVINGAERVVVSQLLRSPGAYLVLKEDRSLGRSLCMAKLIPFRGAWLEFETNKKDVISVKIDRKRKIPVTILLRAIGIGTDEELQEIFDEVDTMPEHKYILSTIRKDETKSTDEAIMELYRRMRPGDPPTMDNAKKFLEALFFNPRRYDLGRVGRRKLNRRLGLNLPLEQRTLTKEDFIALVKHIIMVNNGVENPDDIDHLGNRRVKTVGELIQNQMRIGFLRMERVIRERMSIRDPEQATPISLINIRPVVAASREFFGSSQLSQFMDQTNPLSELTHKRRLSALGPGGLRRERAGFDVRDVHHSHYGRICPIETPEGPNIGLIGSLATYARVNEFGFVETPYRRVRHEVPNSPEYLVGRIVKEEIVDPVTGEVVVSPGTVITQELAEVIAGYADEHPSVKVRAFATDEIVYLSADEEDKYIIAQANAELDEKNQFVSDRISVRHEQSFLIEAPENVDYIDVAPRQVVGVSASLIPFLEHDDANRALMGSNMQRQAVPLIRPQAPIVSTGMEAKAALDSGHVLVAEAPGEVVSVTGERIVVLEDPDEEGKRRERVYELRKYARTNQSTCVDQQPIVYKGQRVEKGEPLTNSSSTEGGELALGDNVLVAFVSWAGGNFEDAILISERLLKEERFSSVHIEQHEVDARDTKLGPEEITRDIPNVGEEALSDLDEDGIIRVGATVSPGDILVGKLTPKGESADLTPEERLLRAIFGEKVREVKDSSLRLPHGEKGRVVDVKVFTREENPDLPAGVEKRVRVSVAQKRQLAAGDKMAGRHGNKGVISKIVPEEDMPFLPDGTPVDIILNPLGVPARMNIGQVLETHLGWAADRLGFRTITAVFDGAREEEIDAELARAWLIDRAWDDLRELALAWFKESELPSDAFEDDEEVIRYYLAQEFLGPRGYDEEAIFTDRVYARRSVLREWLKDRGYDPDAILVFEDDTRSFKEREIADQRALETCLREWIKYRGDEETLSGVDLDSMDVESLQALASEVSKRSGWPVPTTGKMKLYDGRTGDEYDQPVTVGIIYMLKLHHLVEDKVHARSTGPYSLVTQQPLGGKAQFGGQRFGEMEVWALEAYGAAHTLQEMLTVKSDDSVGRVKTYEAIVKGERITSPGVPESFKVLVKELQGLALNVEVLDENGEVISLGKDTRRRALPKLGFSLSVPGPMRR